LKEVGFVLNKVVYLLAIVALLFAGCVEMTVSQTVEKDGSSVAAMSVDASKMSEAVGESDWTETEETDLSDSCANVTDLAVSCTATRTSFSVSKRFSTPESSGFYEFVVENGFPDVVYTLTVKKLPVSSFGLPSEDDENSQALGKEFSSGAAAESVSMMKMMGIKLSYDVTVPGEIVSATPGGKVSANNAKFDLLDVLDEEENIVVKSRELNLPYVAGAAIILLAIIACAAWFVSKRK